MADRGITFSAPMVRALLEGRKTQTRRLIAAQPPEQVTSAGVYSNTEEGFTNRWSWLSGDPRDCDTWSFEGDFKVPHAIGDRLYVREAWKAPASLDKAAPRNLDPATPIYFTADDRLWPVARYRQAMHMPRWASRLWLSVTDVRVQRLQEISEDDAIADGIIKDWVIVGASCNGGRHSEDWDWRYWHGAGDEPDEGFESAVDAYASLWDSLHTDPGTRWEDNPWIYAVSFEVKRGNIDQIGGNA